jgi:hypothetical protein
MPEVMFVPISICPVVGVLYNGCAVFKCKYTGCAFILAMFIGKGKQLFCNFTKRGEVKDFEYCGGYVGVVYLERPSTSLREKAIRASPG